MEHRFLAADYRDGSVRMNGKTYPAGTFVVCLLNQYYKDDLAGRLSVYKMHGWNVLEQLHLGYLNDSDFAAAGGEIMQILNTLPRLSPFENWDVAAERVRIQGLFSQETAEKIKAHFRARSDIGNMDPGQVLFGNLPASYDMDMFKNINATIRDVESTIRFYHSITIFPIPCERPLGSFAPLWNGQMRQTGWTNSICCPLLWSCSTRGSSR